MVNPGRFRTPTCRRSSASRRVSAENPVTLCDLGILADQAAEAVPAENLEVCAWSRWLPTSGRRALLQRPVRAMLVVVIDVLAEDQSQVPFAGYQHPVQALAAGTGDPAFGDSVRPRCLDRCLMIRTPMAANTVSKAAVNLVSRSRIRNFRPPVWSSRFIRRQPVPAPALPRREPAHQPRPAHHGDRAAAEPDQGPRLLRRAASWRHAIPDGHAGTQTAPVQRRFRPLARRPGTTRSEPGRARR